MEAARLATAADLARIAELSGGAIDELRPQRGGSIWSRREARDGPLDVLPVGDSAPIVLAGTIDDVVVGYAVARIEQLRDGGLLALVDDLYVEPDARGVGVGEVLMDWLVAWATEAGCVGIDAMVLPGNRAAKNFFERFGLTARAIVVHRSLGPAAEAGGPPEAPGGPGAPEPPGPVAR
jgi:GNAT superfamily N-acetyltransferase